MHIFRATSLEGHLCPFVPSDVDIKSHLQENVGLASIILKIRGESNGNCKNILNFRGAL